MKVNYNEEIRQQIDYIKIKLVEFEKLFPKKDDLQEIKKITENLIKIKLPINNQYIPV